MKKKDMINYSFPSDANPLGNNPPPVVKPGIIGAISSWWAQITQRREMDSQIPLAPYAMRGSASIAVKDFDTKRAIQEGLKNSDVVYACCRILADAMASVPLIVEKYNATQGAWVRVPNHPLEKLLARPNPFQGCSEILETTAYHLNLAGNALYYLNIVDGMPQEFTVINPQNVEVIVDPINFISAYRYSYGTSFLYLSPDIVCHTRFVDAGNPWWGMSPLLAASRTVDTDVAAGEWNREAMNNRAQPDLIISPENDLTETQYDLFKDSMRQSIQGAGNARNPILMSSKARIDMMSFTAVEMDFMNSRRFNRESICGSFKTPAPLVIFDQGGGSMGNNLSPIFRFYWENTVVPVMDRVVESINQTFIPYYGKEDVLRVRADYTQVKAMQVHNLDAAKIALIYSQIGVPFQAYNKLLQLGFADDVELIVPPVGATSSTPNVDRLHALEDNTTSGTTSGNSNSVPADGIVQ